MSFSVDRTALFGVHAPIAGTDHLRDSVVFFSVFSFSILRRDVGAEGIADILLLVIIADTAQNAMAGEYKSNTEGAILVRTNIARNVLFDWLTSRFPAFAKLAEATALQPIRHDQILNQNLSKEIPTIEDLMSILREQGVETVDEVKHPYIESDGAISIIKRFYHHRDY
jgi:uncharacterized membrane protein YcaP (DUF421 family)